jgi:hypothetical protein
MDVFSDLNSLASDENFDDHDATNDDVLGLDGLVAMFLREDLLNFFHSAMGSCAASDEALDSVHDFVTTQACSGAEEEERQDEQHEPRHRPRDDSLSRDEDIRTKFTKTIQHPGIILRPEAVYSMSTEDIYANPFINTAAVPKRPRRRRTASANRRAFRSVNSYRRRRYQDV